ncbi:hypothetical protein TNCV_2298752 [Trichonephila clavipes]|nr:hypothetical protein TNCV_2298752 [Trichonephila clavipes]
MEKEKKEHLNRKQLLPFCNETDLTNGPSYKSTRKKERKKKSFSDLVTLISSTSLGAFADEEPRLHKQKKDAPIVEDLGRQKLGWNAAPEKISFGLPTERKPDNSRFSFLDTYKNNLSPNDLHPMAKKTNLWAHRRLASLMAYGTLFCHACVWWGDNNRRKPKNTE